MCAGPPDAGELSLAAKEKLLFLAWCWWWAGWHQGAALKLGGTQGFDEKRVRTPFLGGCVWRQQQKAVWNVAHLQERDKLKTEWLNLLFTDQSVAAMSPEGFGPPTSSYTLSLWLV